MYLFLSGLGILLKMFFIISILQIYIKKEPQLRLFVIVVFTFFYCQGIISELMLNGTYGI
jgi:hypothetical protein